MTKDEFLATLLLAGNTAPNSPMWKKGLVQEYQILLPFATGWVRFRPRDNNTLDLNVEGKRWITVGGKKKDLLKTIIQLIEENNHGVA